MAAGEMVLLVNDIPDHAAAYQRALTDHGFRVRLARTGQQALDMVKEAVPECTVIDLLLPDMSGWDLCRELKGPKETREMPIVVLTPDISRMHAADSAKVGCDTWLAHPTAAEDLIRTIRLVLELDPASPEPGDAVLDQLACDACGSDQVRPALRMSSIRFHYCTACGFCWRADALRPQ